MTKIIVPICNDCGKPHYGRKNVEDRCICDTSGNWHEAEIDEEIEEEIINLNNKLFINI